MRLFIAIDLDDASRAAIVREQRRVASLLDDGAKRLRFVRTEHLHLTLVFLGDDVQTLQADDLAMRMSQAVDHAAYRLTFGGIGAFPLRGRPRTLLLGIVSGASETLALHDRMASR